ncbi:MAG: 2-oxo acid dehydrogenase subunit E2 [Chloroflexi bacterium]|nr:2-oxo acid dehydrogenase subunit E2 [Chloroflexota bacterium]MDL1882619.1 2-oxo acid dehydrogenase subunit E2 [Anaerolineae bacterium CFX8]
MATPITLSMEGTFINWLKNVGETVKAGDVVAEVESDKATIEIEAPAAGVLSAQNAQPGDSLAEGAVIGQIGESAAAPAPAAPAPMPAAEPAPAPAAPAPMPADAPAPKRANGAPPAAPMPEIRVKASPLARRIAEEKGIDLRQVAGTGPGGRITKEDVEGFTPPPAPSPTVVTVPGRKLPEGPDVEIIEISTMRKRIAAGTMESNQTTPTFFVTVESDVAALMALRKQLNDSLPEGATKISVNDLIVKAVALALRQFPNLNSHYYGDKLARHLRVNIGIAVAVPQGGVIYVVAKDADKLSLGALAELNKAMIARAREGKIKPDDISGATFSISNLGPYDVEHFTAIINPPEAGVLAVGSARAVPVVKEGGTLGVGQRMRVTLSVDHRVSDGAEGAEFLQFFRQLIENPMRLLI